MRHGFLFAAMVFASLATSAAYAIEAEFEPNNSEDDANWIESGVSTAGQNATRTDLDYFTFDALGSMTATFKFFNENTSIFDYNKWLVEIYRSDGISLSRKNILAFEEETTWYVGLPETGRHYVVITDRGESNKDQYILTITYESWTGFGECVISPDNKKQSLRQEYGKWSRMCFD